MYLKRLELHGFKSFAHKTALDFDSGLTAVVGPNGSGKSNVSDAIRWVMGEQSLKLLRGKKSEDVIFAGSDQKAKLSLAEVTLLFDNKDRKLPFDYSEVAIARRLYRNGESEYLINNNRVRLMDVVDCLLRSGFGATNYAVIGQGTIDQMVMSGPMEIKTLIEEASGVKPYYLKKDKTLRRLGQTEENLAQVGQLLGEIEPRLRSLKRQARRMEEREAVANELAELQLQFFGQQFHVLETELKVIRERADVKRSLIKRLETEISAFQKTSVKEEQQTEQADSFLDELERQLAQSEERRLILAEQLAEVKGQLRAELPVTKNFSEFRAKFEVILDLLRSDNIDEIKQKLRGLVSVFGESKNEELAKRQATLSRELERAAAEMNDHKQLKVKLLTEAKQKKNFLSEEEKKFRVRNAELGGIKDELTAILIEQAKLDARLESIQKESQAALGEKHSQIDQYRAATVAADLVNKISRLKRQLEMTGGIDEQVLTEYRETQERFDYLSGQSQDLARAVADLKGVIEELDEMIKTQFDEAFRRIADKFAEYFRILFNGGAATMTLLKEYPAGAAVRVDEMEDESASVDGIRTKHPGRQIVGIEIKATPPGKKLATVTALSGGERALTAIALLCSLLACYPSPFVVLDEVDAALDEANSQRFGKILGTLAHQTQFITITHNRETMRQAHTLYGVTMDDHGVSKILSIKLEKAVAIAE